MRSTIDYKKNDYRSLWSATQIKSWRKGLQLIKKINPKVDIESIALRFVLTEKLISSALVGVRSVIELNKNLYSKNLDKLNKDFFEKIKHINESNNFFIKKKKEHKIKMKNILVVGGSGFVGSNLLNILAKKKRI